MSNRVSIAAALLCAAAPLAAETATLAEVQRALAATRTFTAAFTQVAQDGRAVAGRLTLRRPGQARFDYGRGSKLLLVADKGALNVIDYEVGQLSRWPIRESPLGVLLDPAADLARYARVLPAAESPRPDWIAVAARDPKRPELGRITFFLARAAVAPGGMTLIGWNVIDAQGQSTRVMLSDTRANGPVGAGAFAFRDPRVTRKPPGKTQ